MYRRLSLLTMLVVGCAESVSSTTEDVTNPDSITVPPSVVRVTIVSEPVRGQRHLLRLDPATGTVDTDLRFAQLDALDTPYLTMLEDGRVLLAGTDNSGVFVGVLDRDVLGRISIGAQYRAAGSLAMMPAVAHGKIARPLAITSSSGEVAIRPITILPSQMR